MSLGTKIYFFKHRLNLFLKKCTYFFLPYPLQNKVGQYSMINAYFTQKSTNPSKYLYDLAIKAILKINDYTFEEIVKRNPGEAHPMLVSVGEHYKILASFVDILKPKSIIEVGTYTGMSSLAMKKYMPKDCVLTTFDIVNSFKYKECVFTEADFADKRLLQELADISNKNEFLKHKDLFENADIIFLDAAKDKVQERKFFENFATCNFKNRPIIILDDIQVWNMIKIWESIPYPKFDITSFGHYSGTGLVDINYKKFNDGQINQQIDK